MFGCLAQPATAQHGHAHFCALCAGHCRPWQRRLRARSTAVPQCSMHQCRAGLSHAFFTHTHTTHTRLQAQAEEAAYTLADELANIARRVSQIDGTLKLKDREIARLRKQVCACSMQCVFVLCAVSVCAGCRVECDECGCIVVCGQILCICPLASGAREVHSACTCLQSQPQSWQGAACTFGCLSAQTRLVMHS